MQVDVLEDSATLVRQGALLRAHPSIHFLLDHLEEALGIDGVDVDLGLETAVFVRPRQRLAYHSVRPELCQALVHRVEDGFVQYVLALLCNRVRQRRDGREGGVRRGVLLLEILFAPLLLMCQLVRELALLLHVEVHVDGQDGELERVEAGLEVAVATQLLGLHLTQLFERLSPLRLRQTHQEDRQVVDASIELQQHRFLVLALWNLELQQVLQQLVDVAVSPDQIPLDVLPLFHFDHLPYLVLELALVDGSAQELVHFVSFELLIQLGRRLGRSSLILTI